LKVVTFAFIGHMSIHKYVTEVFMKKAQADE
jgi:hypothetical protein